MGLPVEAKALVAHIRNRSMYRTWRRSTSSSDPISVFDDLKCIFIHVPKTGGKSIKRSLFGDEKMMGGHKTATELMKIFGPLQYHRYFSFSFVRNPYTRVLSAYEFLRKGGINEDNRKFSEKYLKNCKNFEDFIHNFIDKKEIINYCHFRPQHHYVCSSSGRVLVDMVGKTENLESDFEKVCDRIGVSKALSHSNKTRYSKNYESRYTKECIKKINRIYAKDFSYFGYQLGSFK